jgi:hypothetical protein
MAKEPKKIVKQAEKQASKAARAMSNRQARKDVAKILRDKGDKKGR